MKNLRQIVTKAVVAKGKKRTETKETLCPPNKPTSILGCWVINHTQQAKKVGKYVEVAGKFDVNVWYSHSKHSKTSVFTETIAYKDRIRLHYRDEPTSRHEEVLVNVLQHPNCTEATISKCGQNFVISVERELVVEVIGETKICVRVHPCDFEEEWPIRDESSSHHHHHGHEHPNHGHHGHQDGPHGHQHGAHQDQHHHHGPGHHHEHPQHGPHKGHDHKGPNHGPHDKDGHHHP